MTDNNVMNRLEGGIKGALLGVIVGDALGLPVQFLSRGEVQSNPVTDMRGYGTYGMPAGTWSDDGSMTIASMDSLLHGEDLNDMMERFASWYRDGKYTQIGMSFDVGGATKRAMRKYLGGIPAGECGCSGEWDNGNGSLMRIAPVAVYHAIREHTSQESAEEMLAAVNRASALTHAHPVAMMGCGIYSMILERLLVDRINGEGSRAGAVGNAVRRAYDGYKNGAGRPEGIAHYTRFRHSYDRLTDVATFAALPESEIRSSGFVVHTLEAAVWCFLNTESFSDCLLKAVNLGEDTDSVAAVAGGLAGAWYGLEAIPQEWLQSMKGIGKVISLADDFVEMLRGNLEDLAYGGANCGGFASESEIRRKLGNFLKDSRNVRGVGYCPICGTDLLEGVFEDRCETCGWVFDDLADANDDAFSMLNWVSMNVARKMWKDGISIHADNARKFWAEHGDEYELHKEGHLQFMLPVGRKEEKQ